MRLLSPVLVGYLWLCASAPVTHSSSRRCVFLSSPWNLKMKEPGVVMSQGNASVQRCARASCCLGYYRLADGGPPVADLLGCDYMPRRPCPNTTCQLDPAREFESHVTCLCGSDLCNGNVTWSQEPPTESPTGPPPPQQPAYVDGLSIMGCGMVVCLVVVAAVKWRNFFQEHACLALGRAFPCLRGKPRPPSEGPLTSDQPDVDLTGLQLQQVVGQGDFAAVWRGLLQGSTVAVKVFPAGRKHRFTAEREVYGLPLLVHDGICPFLGAGRLGGGERVLLMELAARGSLRCFLSKSGTDWPSSLLMCRSLCEGLAFLHSDLYRHGSHKPPVAHRDLSSSNVLVRADGSCALCDFGCSTILHTRTPGRANTQGGVAVGTLRYMSPELLEGSVNLGQVSWSLLQVDVYALALLLWEVWTRCSDLHTGRPVPEHQLPYEAELGACPSLEDVMLHVAERRQRPLIPRHWEKDLHGAALAEILTDCWDHDADARLTSLCVTNRLLSLPRACSI